MSILYSPSLQLCFSKNLSYLSLPEDCIEIDATLGTELIDAKNSGCIIFADLTYSKPKPSQFHLWDGSSWVDNRTAEEISDYERSLLPVLPKRQFALYLFDHQLYDQVMSALDQNPRFKIEYETVKDLERMSPTVSAMTELLGWTDNQVDEMWRQALEL